MRIYVAQVQYDNGNEPISNPPVGDPSPDSKTFGGRHNDGNLNDALEWLGDRLANCPPPRPGVCEDQTARWYGWVERGTVTTEWINGIPYDEYEEDDNFQRRYFSRNTDGVMETT